MELVTKVVSKRRDIKLILLNGTVMSALVINTWEIPVSNSGTTGDPDVRHLWETENLKHVTAFPWLFADDSLVDHTSTFLLKH